jgi:hypothetical protein
VADEQSVLSTVESTVKSVVGLTAEGLAQAIGLITAAREAIRVVAAGVATAATLKTVTAANAKYQGAPLTPADLADMIVRNILPDSTGAAGLSEAGYPAPYMGQVNGGSASNEAMLSGLTPERFKALVYQSGESYGIMDALRLWNRGQYLYQLQQTAQYKTGTPLYGQGPSMADEYGITEAELDRVIAHSRVRPQFTDDLKKLAQNSVSPADAVEMAVKQVVGPNEAKALYGAAGGIPEQFDALVDAAGDSAGVEKAVELYCHGVLTKAQLTQIVAMSRLNPRFYYLTEANPDDGNRVPLNYRWLDPYQISEAAKAGTITAKQALDWLLQSGYPPEQAQAFATTVAAGTVSKQKEESLTMVLDEYQAGILDEAKATTAITALGYEANAVPYLLDYALAKATLAARNSALAKVRAAYLVGEVANDQATHDLSQLGLPQPAINTYLADWAVERATPRRTLTEAQIGKLLGEGYISEATALAKWEGLGLSAGDAALLLMIYPAPAAGAPPPAGSPGTPAVTRG